MNSSLIRRASWLFLFSSVALSEEAYRFTLNGKEIVPWIIKVNGPEIVMGDVAQVEDFFFCLDEPGHYDLETDSFECLNRKTPGGLWKRIACKINAPAEDGGDPSARLFRRKKPNSEVALGFTEEEVKDLRGMRIGDWSPSLESWLGRLDLKRVCIYLDSGSLGGHDKPAIPKLPHSVRHLILDSGGSWGCKDLSPLARLPELRFLSLAEAMPAAVDLKLLSGLPLEYLSLPSFVPLENLAALQSMPGLKTLEANSCYQIGDARFLSGMTGLRQVFLRHISSMPETPARPLELAALGKLPHLVVFNAANSSIASLPSGQMPALRFADILLCGLKKEVVDMFVKANPQAQIKHSLNAELQSRLIKADRLRVRSGGVCHRDQADEKTIFDSKIATEVSELAGRFQVTEENSGGHCMCCGNPTFEFYRGDTLIAMLGFHHGRTIRWADGNWPGDGMMEAGNAAFLIDWLDQRGFNGPKKEWQDQRRQEAAARRRWQRYEAILPPAVATRLNAAKNWDEITFILDSNVPKDAEGATLLLRLFGSDFENWSHYNAMDSQLAEKLLPGFPEDKLTEAIINALPKTEEGLGAVRWLFGEGKAEQWKDGQATLETLARFALTHPDQDNRWRCLTVMRNVGAPFLPLMREVMRKGTQPRATPQELDDGGGQVVFRPSYLELPAGSSDQEVAAFCLQMLGDEETHAETEHIRLSLPEATKNGSEASVKHYQATQKEK